MPPTTNAPHPLREMHYEKRVFADDVLRCPCGGRCTVVAVVTVVAVARVVLATIGLPNELATFAPDRGPPQGDLWCEDASA